MYWSHRSCILSLLSCTVTVALSTGLTDQWLFEIVKHGGRYHAPSRYRSAMPAYDKMLGSRQAVGTLRRGVRPQGQHFDPFTRRLPLPTGSASSCDPILTSMVRIRHEMVTI